MYTFIAAIVQKSKSHDSWVQEPDAKARDNRSGNKTGKEADLAATHS